MSQSTQVSTMVFNERCQAKNIMTPQVIPVSSDWSIQQLAEFLIANGISGAPVLDETEQLIGVVSVTDIARQTSIASEELDIVDHHQFYTDGLDFTFDGDLISETGKLQSHTMTVSDIMTPAIHQIDESALLDEVCADMVKNRIHRIFVSANKKIIGVISALDILSYIQK